MLLALIARPAPAPRHASIRAALPHAGAPMDRRTALGAFAAAMVPFAAQSEEVIEEEGGVACVLPGALFVVPLRVL